MLRILVPTLLLILVSATARAEDFSGFYAGINGGYGAGRERDRAATAPVPSGLNAAGTGRDGSDLPPSAVGAAASMKGAGSAGSRGSAAH